MSETVTPWEFSVEGEQGTEADEHTGDGPDGPEIEVTAKPTRRRFTVEYKRKIVREADGCKTPGAIGALLRQEGLYFSHLTAWRAARDRGELAGLARKRGPVPQTADPRDKKIAELERETARWRKRAERAEALVEVQKKLTALLGTPREPERPLMATVTEVGPRLGIAPTCAALGLPRATYYRRRRPRVGPRRPRRPAPRALAAEERAGSSRCCTSRGSWTSPPQRFTRLCSTKGSTCAPSGRCIASWRPTTRCGSAANQLRHPRYAAPELLARRPNELWSWDITKLLGPAKWTYFYLYVMLDVFSRYVVGWMVAHRESATLAERFIRETCARQGIARDQLTIHADRGPR